jgi:hypothetical protein
MNQKMTTSKKAAPQQEVIEVIRSGRWGKVEYIHKLSCGHAEVRKRAASTAKVACEGCLKAEIGTQMLAELSRPKPVFADFSDIHDEIAASVASYEQDVARTKAALAKKLGVEVGAVDIYVDETSDTPKIVQAVVFLEAFNIERILGSDSV